jgi:hypothetical protein
LFVGVPLHAFATVAQLGERKIQNAVIRPLSGDGLKADRYLSRLQVRLLPVALCGLNVKRGLSLLMIPPSTDIKLARIFLSRHSNQDLIFLRVLQPANQKWG